MPGLSNRELNLGNAVQRAMHFPGLGALSRFARWVIAGSDCSNQVWPDYRAARHLEIVNPDPVDDDPLAMQSDEGRGLWVTARANPEAGRYPRSWKWAVVLGMGRSALGRMAVGVAQELLPEETDRATLERHALDLQAAGALQPAAMYVHNKLPRVLALPRFGTVSNTDLVGVAMRQGGEPIRASMGFWHHPTEAVYIPPPGYVTHVHQKEGIGALIRTADLAERYPDVPLV